MVGLRSTSPTPVGGADSRRQSIPPQPTHSDQTNHRMKSRSLRGAGRGPARLEVVMVRAGYCATPRLAGIPAAGHEQRPVTDMKPPDGSVPAVNGCPVLKSVFAYFYRC